MKKALNDPETNDASSISSAVPLCPSGPGQVKCEECARKLNFIIKTTEGPTTTEAPFNLYKNPKTTEYPVNTTEAPFNLCENPKTTEYPVTTPMHQYCEATTKSVEITTECPTSAPTNCQRACSLKIPMRVDFSCCRDETQSIATVEDEDETEEPSIYTGQFDPRASASATGACPAHSTSTSVDSGCTSQKVSVTEELPNSSASQCNSEPRAISFTCPEIKNTSYSEMSLEEPLVNNCNDPIATTTQRPKRMCLMSTSESTTTKCPITTTICPSTTTTYLTTATPTYEVEIGLLPAYKFPSSTTCRPRPTCRRRLRTTEEPTEAPKKKKLKQVDMSEENEYMDKMCKYGLDIGRRSLASYTAKLKGKKKVDTSGEKIRSRSKSVFMKHTPKQDISENLEAPDEETMAGVEESVIGAEEGVENISEIIAKKSKGKTAEPSGLDLCKARTYLEGKYDLDFLKVDLNKPKVVKQWRRKSSYEKSIGGVLPKTKQVMRLGKDNSKSEVCDTEDCIMKNSQPKLAQIQNVMKNSLDAVIPKVCQDMRDNALRECLRQNFSEVTDEKTKSISGSTMYEPNFISNQASMEICQESANKQDGYMKPYLCSMTDKQRDSISNYQKERELADEKFKNRMVQFKLEERERQLATLKNEKDEECEKSTERSDMESNEDCVQNGSKYNQKYFSDRVKINWRRTPQIPFRGNKTSLLRCQHNSYCMKKPNCRRYRNKAIDYSSDPINPIRMTRAITLRANYNEGRIRRALDRMRRARKELQRRPLFVVPKLVFD